MPDILRSLFVPSFLLPFVLDAQTFTGSGAAIPDDGTVLELPLEVSGLPPALDTTAFGLEQVCFTIEHTWISDLDIRLVAPDGSTRLLVVGQGGDTDHFEGTCLRADATTPITEASSPYNGTYRPQGQMGGLNNGQDGNGTWHLRILDTYPFADAGEVIAWSITFGGAPATYLAFNAVDLPLVVIDTDNTPIPDAEKIPATMGIVDNGPSDLNHPTDPFNGYDGHIGIELRGFSSQLFTAKKSYGVELRDGSGNDLDAPLLGMPAESDWVLSANHYDKSLLNNTLTYHLARAMGHYAARHRHVEVILDGEYQGVYVLMEKIKRDGDRLDIAKLDPGETFGDDLTGGYILSVERDAGPDNGFTSTFAPAGGSSGQQIYLEYRYPKPQDIVEEQRTYIQDYLNAFETALAGPDLADPQTGYAAYADAASFVDVFLLNEYSRNVDGYRLSSYLFKDKDSNGGKLRMGPVWDYDIAWGNADYCSGSAITGWAYEFGDVCDDPNQVPFWWSRLLDDPHYRDLVRCRWNELRDGLLSPTNIAAYCDSVAAVLEHAQQRNFTTWPILGQYVWPNPSPIPTTYAGEIQELKDFALARFNWLDTHLPGNAANCGTVGTGADATTSIAAPFPNPFVDQVFVGSTASGPIQAELLDAMGRAVMPPARLAGKGQQRVQLPAALAPGTYVLVVTDASGVRRSFRLQH
ncbi:MAG TPA: CotH kinase family protein [Flavobacteriales bacterium]